MPGGLVSRQGLCGAGMQEIPGEVGPCGVEDRSIGWSRSLTNRDLQMFLDQVKSP